MVAGLSCLSAALPPLPNVDDTQHGLNFELDLYKQVRGLVQDAMKYMKNWMILFIQKAEEYFTRIAQGYQQMEDPIQFWTAQVKDIKSHSK